MSEKLSESQSKTSMTIKYPVLYLLIPLSIFFIFDQLTWERRLGLQCLITVVLILVGLLILTAIEKKSIPWQSFLLFVPILFGAVMTVIRKDISTTIFNFILTLSSLLLLALSLLNGQWLIYRFREILNGLLLLVQSILVGPILALVTQLKSKQNSASQQKRKTIKKIRPYLVGILITLPLLFVLGALLARADLVFKARLSNMFDWIKFENFGEFVWRTFYILCMTYILAGAYIHALTLTASKKSINDNPWVKPFLGNIEAFIVLVLVNLLFLGFIIIQFRYFFAGEANISLEGFTYAEYARRGFFELVAVAIISLGLYYTLSMVTKRTTPIIKRVFSALGVMLILQVGCMLISAFQRLSLYEVAYGFTKLRTLTHIFMVWLGILLLSAVLMEIFNHFRRMALVLFLVLFGFTVSINLLNLDGFIAKRNIEHAIMGNPLDVSYIIGNLSDDAIPALLTSYQAEDTPDDIKETLYATLACIYARRIETDNSAFWASWHLASARTDSLFEKNQSVLNSYPFIERSERFYFEENNQTIKGIYNNKYINVNGEEVWCTSTEKN